MAIKKNRNPRKDAHKRKLSIETLESRANPSFSASYVNHGGFGELLLLGDNSSEHISVRRAFDGGVPTLLVTYGNNAGVPFHAFAEFPINPPLSPSITLITVNAGAGNDLVDLNSGFDFVTLLDGSRVHSDPLGITASIDGGADSDRLAGGNLNDTITGNAGSDLIFGNEGDDSLDGAAGADRIYGSVGKDTIGGGSENDILYGNDDDDTIDGEGGNDKIFGGNSDDSLMGGEGNDVINGEKGFDTIFGGNGNDVLSGNNDDDTIDGEGGNDRIFGLLGNDTLTGGSGNDFIDGGLQNDSLSGGTGDDTLFGNVGDDTLDGGVGGTDRLIGGPGFDQFKDGEDFGTPVTFKAVLSGTELDIDGGAGATNDHVTVTQVTISGVSYLTVSQGATQVLIDIGGGVQVERLRLFTDVDSMRIDVGDGNDTVAFGTVTFGATVRGGNGNDVIVAGSGNDTLEGGAGNDRLAGNRGNDRLFGFTAASPDDPSDGIDVIYGGDGNDTVQAGAGNDIVLGGNGDDSLLGGFGNDKLLGEANNDKLFGGVGADSLSGSTGIDEGDGGTDLDTDLAFSLETAINFP